MLWIDSPRTKSFHELPLVFGKILFTIFAEERDNGD